MMNKFWKMLKGLPVLAEPVKSLAEYQAEDAALRGRPEAERVLRLGLVGTEVKGFRVQGSEGEAGAGDSPVAGDYVMEQGRIQAVPYGVDYYASDRVPVPSAEAMARAGRQVGPRVEVMALGGRAVLNEVVRGQGAAVPGQHEPVGDDGAWQPYGTLLSTMNPQPSTLPISDAATLGRMVTMERLRTAEALEVVPGWAVAELAELKARVTVMASAVAGARDEVQAMLTMLEYAQGERDAEARRVLELEGMVQELLGQLEQLMADGLSAALAGAAPAAKAVTGIRKPRLPAAVIRKAAVKADMGKPARRGARGVAK